MRKIKVCGLHEHVIEEIGKGVVSGKFVSGRALPTEEQLCIALGVSRTALREALRVLTSKGLLEPRRKLGTLVRPSEHWNFLDADILQWLLQAGESEQVIDELYELRHLLEPVAASLAAQNARMHDLKALRQAYEAMGTVSDDGERIVAPDLQFHQAIIAASGNRLFSSLTQVIGAALEFNFRLIRDVPQGHAQSVTLHKRVLDAIEVRDPAAARVAMQSLIEQSRRDARSIKSSRRRELNVRARKAIQRL